MVSPEVAKASAARHALTMATELGWTHIQLEWDCMVVVNALNDRSATVFDLLVLLSRRVTMLFLVLMSFLVCLLDVRAIA